MQAQKVIEQLGYKSNEAKVYLTALGVEECTVSDIAKKLKLPRSSVQIIVEKLHTDGLMNFYTKRRYKYWSAEDPVKFLLKLREKESILEGALPRLSSIRRALGEKPTIKVFLGAHEIRLIHEDILMSKHHIQGIIPWDEWIALFGRDYMDDFIATRAHHFLKMQLLIPHSRTGSELKEKDSKQLRHTRFLPTNVDIGDTIFIYGNKVAIVSLNKKQPTGILIEDEATAHTMNAFFELAWNAGTE